MIRRPRRCWRIGWRGSTNWQQLKLLALSKLAGAVSTSITSGAAEPNVKFQSARRKIIEFVQGSILTQAGKIQEAGPGAFLEMYQTLKGDLTPAEKG